MSETQGAPARRQPQTGAEYLASLSDGREVHLDGERVADVTSHPGLRNHAASVARLYEALHRADNRSRWSRPTTTGSGGWTHRAFVPATSAAELGAMREAMAGWARLSFGWLGRPPDYKAAFTNTLGANAGFYGPFEANARRWHRRAQEELPFLNHAIVNPPLDRHRPATELGDLHVHVVRETGRGLVVSGAKVVATAAAVCQYNLIAQAPKCGEVDPATALAFLVPCSASGVRLVCRPSYELAAHRGGSPFDQPLSSRFDENDAILVLEEVEVPWEDVLIHRDPERSRALLGGSGFLNGYLFHGCTRFAVKLDFLCALLARALHLTGGDEARGTRALLGEAVAWRHTFHALADAMADRPDRWTGGCVLPGRAAGLAYATLAPECYPRLREIALRTVTSGLIYLPSSVRELERPELRPLLERYVRGSHGAGAVERIKVLRLLWDAIGSEFASRQELYERTYGGGWEDLRLMVLADAEKSGRLASGQDLVDQCLADYDTHGWVGPVWHSGEVSPSLAEAGSTGGPEVAR